MTLQFERGISMKETKKVIVFQGDSITDCGRFREDPRNLGQGYPTRVAGQMGLKYPRDYEFYNRGVSGDRIVDIYARMKRDIINLKPDYLSILVGVNDVWHERDFGNGVSAPKFKKVFGILLDELKEELPELKIMLLEPFVCHGEATKENYEWFEQEVFLRAKAVKELAQEHGLVFVPLQADLDAMIPQASGAHWLFDGVHPTVFFHEYIAEKWMEAFFSNWAEK